MKCHTFANWVNVIQPLISKYKINLGHNDLYFTVQWFLVYFALKSILVLLAKLNSGELSCPATALIGLGMPPVTGGKTGQIKSLWYVNSSVMGCISTGINQVHVLQWIFISLSHMSPVKRICVFEHSVMTNFNCACPAIQGGQGSGFLSESSSWLTACMSEQRRFWRDCANAQARLNLRCSHRR